MLGMVLFLAAYLDLHLSAVSLRQGEILFISVHTDRQGLLELDYREEPYPMIPSGDSFIAVIGTSYRTDPGLKQIRITFSQAIENKEVVDTAVRVLPREFRKSVITLPRSKRSAIDTSDERRKEEEYKAVREAINAASLGFYAILPKMLPCAQIISGTYGDERWTGGRKLWNHAGVDFAVPEGTPILAPAPGLVLMARDTFIRQGTFVILDHGSGLKTMYDHMKRRVVEEGEVVSAGDTLGFVGSTGLSTGPHLHMSVYVSGVPVDPLFWLERTEQSPR